MSDEGRWIDIVFDELPGPDGCRFIEVEDEQRRGMAFGEWVVRDDGYACLRIPDPAAPVEAARRVVGRRLHTNTDLTSEAQDDLYALRTALNPEGPHDGD